MKEGFRLTPYLCLHYLSVRDRKVSRTFFKTLNHFEVTLHASPYSKLHIEFEFLVLSSILDKSLSAFTRIQMLLAVFWHLSNFRQKKADQGQVFGQSIFNTFCGGGKREGAVFIVLL